MLPASPITEPLLVNDLGSAREHVQAAEGPWAAVIDAAGGVLGAAATLRVVATPQGGHIAGGSELALTDLLRAVRASVS